MKDKQGHWIIARTKEKLFEGVENLKEYLFDVVLDKDTIEVFYKKIFSQTYEKDVLRTTEEIREKMFKGYVHYIVWWIYQGEGMKYRENGFLEKEFNPQTTETGDYIRELHHYLWRFVRTVIPTASGELRKYIDIAIEEAERGHRRTKCDQ